MIANDNQLFIEMEWVLFVWCACSKDIQIRRQLPPTSGKEYD